MKKNIEVIHLDQDFVSRLAEQVCPILGDPAMELRRALREMADGSCETLLLSIDEKQSSGGHSSIQCGALSINALSRRVLRNGEEILLTPKEFDILWFLASNRGQVFTKEQIYQAVWDGDYMLDSSNVMAFIRKLRKKIEPNPDAPRYILTIWGIGYKFNDRIEA